MLQFYQNTRTSAQHSVWPLSSYIYYIFYKFAHSFSYILVYYYNYIEQRVRLEFGIFMCS